MIVTTEQEIARLIIRIQAQTAEIQTALNNTRRDISSFRDSISTAGDVLKKVFIGLGIAVSIRQINNEIKNTITAIDRMIIAAQKTGLSIEVFSGFTASAERARVPIDYLIMGLKFLAQSMYNSIRGLSDAQYAFENLGISIADQEGNLRPVKDVLLDISERFSRMEDSAAKTAMTIKIFGRSSEQLINWLNQGADVIRANIEEAEKFGIVLNDKTGLAVIDFREDTIRLHQALRGLFITIANELLPELTKLVNKLIIIVVDIKDLIERSKGFLSLPWNILRTIVDNFQLFVIAVEAALLIKFGSIIGGWIASLGSLTLALGSATIAVQSFCAAIGSVAAISFIIGITLGKIIDQLAKKLTGKTISGKAELKEAIEDLKKAQNELQEILNKNREKKLFYLGKLDEQNAALDRLLKKILEFKAQIINLIDPQEAAKTQLENFIAETTKGIPMTNALTNAISKLRNEFEKFQQKQREKALFQIISDEELNKEKDALETIKKSIEHFYEEGMISIEQYYAKLRGNIEDSAQIEINYLNYKKNQTKDVIELRKIDAQISDILLKKGQDIIQNYKDQDNALKNLSITQLQLSEMMLGSRAEALAPEEAEINARYVQEEAALDTHYAEMIARIQTFSEEKIKVGQEYMTKEEALAELRRNQELAKEKIHAENLKEITDLRLKQATDAEVARLRNTQYILNGLNDIVDQIYEKGNKKMKAMFYVQKAIAIAQAYVNTALAATQVIKEYGIIGSSMIPAIWSIGMAQIAVIMQQTIKGMVKGGLITGGNGGIDDIPIRATRGEYVLPVPAVKYYGIDLLNAMKRMLIPRNNFQIPALAGAVAGGGGNSLIINVPVNVDGSERLAGRLRDAIELTVQKVVGERL